MATEIENIISLLNQTFHAGAWHGPSVKEALEGIGEEEARWRIGETHSVIELVAHMTSWRIYVVKKLAGDATYTVPDDQNFPSATDWPSTVRQLEDSQRQLIDSLQKTPVGRLNEIVPGVKTPLTYYTLLHSIIHHDLYHTGQISLIKKARAKQTI